jgi:hypothetical protein
MGFLEYYRSTGCCCFSSSPVATAARLWLPWLLLLWLLFLWLLLPWIMLPCGCSRGCCFCAGCFVATPTEAAVWLLLPWRLPWLQLLSSVPDSWHFGTDPDPWIQFTWLRNWIWIQLRIRILLFLSLTFKMPTKNVSVFKENKSLKGLSHEIDFKNVDSNLQNLA